MDTEVLPNIDEWDAKKQIPEHIYQTVAKRGWLAGLIGMKYPAQYCKYRVASVSPEKWDQFHEFIITDELSRSGSGGFVWNILGGYGIGCPPLIKHGKKSLVDRIMPSILQGLSLIHI